MYLNDSLVNPINRSLGCCSDGSLGCPDCPLQKHRELAGDNLGFAGQQFVSSAASYAGSFIPIPGAGPVIGGLVSLFSSLFGGGPTKEQKQSGVYLQQAKASYASGTHLPATPEELMEFLQTVTTTGIQCGSKWCPGISQCTGAEGRGCWALVMYNVYKMVGGPQDIQNPAYSTFGGGESMVQGIILPYFRQLLQSDDFLNAMGYVAVQSNITTIEGTYTYNGPCSVRKNPDGSYTAVNERGEQSRLLWDGGQTALAVDWNTQGTFTGNSINWDNGTAWSRADAIQYVKKTSLAAVAAKVTQAGASTVQAVTQAVSKSSLGPLLLLGGVVYFATRKRAA